MNVSGLLAWVRALPTYEMLREDLAAGGSPVPLGLLRTARPALATALASDLQLPMVIVTGSAERSRSLHRSIQHYSANPSLVLRFPEPPAVFYEQSPWPRETIGGRMSILHS